MYRHLWLHGIIPLLIHCTSPALRRIATLVACTMNKQWYLHAVPQAAGTQ